jgi:inner membrane protein
VLFWHLGMTAVIIFVTLGRRRIDYRVVLLGAILPDLLDKPIGRIFFEDTFQTSRIFGHTLAFVLILMTFVQVFLRGETARRWFVLAIAALIHLALDAMWTQPVTLFWPLFGTDFPKDPVSEYWLQVLLRPFEHPLEALKELAGLAVLIYLGFAFDLFRKQRFKEFIRTGKLEEKRGRFPESSPTDSQEPSPNGDRA